MTNDKPVDSSMGPIRN